MKFAFIFIVLCGAAANPVFGQTPINPAYKIRPDRGLLTIKFRDKSYRLDVAQYSDAAKITEMEILFSNEKDGFRYLVIDIGGWSRENQNDRQCGAGTESNLVWLKIDEAWKIAGAKSVRYQSCWSGTELNDAFKITANSLALDFDNIREKVNVKLFYNPLEPEKGFQITAAKLKEN